MSAARILKSSFGIMILIVTFLFPVAGSAQAEELDGSIRSRETSFYRDMFDSLAYESLSGLIRFDHVWDTLSFKKRPALDVNRFDEVPDSSFFVNRHGKTRMSLEALQRGPTTGGGPDPAGPWRVLKGKVEGVSAGFFIEDNKGERYLLKFDPKDHLEMATAAEVITHDFFHAIGYHVAEYYLVKFKPDILKVDPNAMYYDENGFKKKLDKDGLWDLVGRIPKLKGGYLRGSASKLLMNHRGYMDIDGRRKEDPDDVILHEDRRSIRALRVFGSWLNHYDLRKGNTLDVLVTEGGKTFVRHYLIDFGSTLGSAADHPKVPVAGHEHVVDWFEVGEGIPKLKMSEEPWEKRWDRAERSVARPALGYFDNFNFHPEEWKAQLHYDAFDRLTKSDAFWAAKVIMAFTDEDVRKLVEAGQYSDPEDAQILGDLLIVRRDIVGAYWFSEVTALDQIKLFHNQGNSYEITLEDLDVKYGFHDASSSMYQLKMAGGETKSAQSPSFTFQADPSAVTTLWIQAKHGSGSWSKPPLKIVLAPAGDMLQISEIDHGL